MIKQINRILKLVGFNLVRAKKPKGRAVKNSHTCKSGDATATTCIGDPPSDGRTHYVGDNCPGGPRDLIVAESSGYIANGDENVAVGYKTMARVVNPDAAFVPVDIGVDDHKMTDTEHWETAGGTTPEQNEARFETPRKGATEANQ